jgi:cell division protein FtsX
MENFWSFFKVSQHIPERFSLGILLVVCFLFLSRVFSFETLKQDDSVLAVFPLKSGTLLSEVLFLLDDVSNLPEVSSVQFFTEEEVLESFLSSSEDIARFFTLYDFKNPFLPRLEVTLSHKKHYIFVREYLQKSSFVSFFAFNDEVFEEQEKLFLAEEKTLSPPVSNIGIFISYLLFFVLSVILPFSPRLFSIFEGKKPYALFSQYSVLVLESFLGVFLFSLLTWSFL